MVAIEAEIERLHQELDEQSELGVKQESIISARRAEGNAYLQETTRLEAEVAMIEDREALDHLAPEAGQQVGDVREPAPEDRKAQVEAVVGGGVGERRVDEGQVVAPRRGRLVDAPLGAVHLAGGLQSPGQRQLEAAEEVPLMDWPNGGTSTRTSRAKETTSSGITSRSSQR